MTPADRPDELGNNDMTHSPAQATQAMASSDEVELVQVLTEITSGLDDVQKQLDPFLEKLERGEYNSKHGLSYLDSKHLLLMFYCQSLVFYILLKANGRSVEDHPVVARLIEIRLYLEKIRPIDKKLRYQIEKLLKLATGVSGGAGSNAPAALPDDLLYKPNPDMLVAKIDEQSMEKDAIYRPPMIAPVVMDEEKFSRDKKFEVRARKDALRKASRSALVKELAGELEGRPEEIKEFVGIESKEIEKELSRLETRAQQEEAIFARVPLSRIEKKRLKHLKRSRNGLMGMLDDFDDDIAHLVDMDENKRDGVPPPMHIRNSKKTLNSKRQKTLTSQGRKTLHGKKRRK